MQGVSPTGNVEACVLLSLGAIALSLSYIGRHVIQGVHMRFDPRYVG